MRTRVVGLVFLLAIGGCAGEPLEFADWEMSLPEGIPVVEYGPVPFEERTERIELVRDLVIGARGDDPNYSFYRPLDVAVDEAGRIYVLDVGNHRIQVFDAEGEYVSAIGREGSGPGEIDSGGRLAVVGDTLVRSGDNRLTVWRIADGELSSDRQVTFTQFLFPLFGTDAGTLVGRYTAGLGSDGEAQQVLARISLDAEQVHDLVRVHTPEGAILKRGTTWFSIPIPNPSPDFAVARGGDAYATRGAEYQVLAWSADAEPKWAMRVAWPRLPVTDDEIETALEARRERVEDIRRSEVDWPEYNPALADRGGALRIDGHGHLYVFPFVRRAEEGELRPVDVYAADGARLFSGMIDAVPWVRARGDFVYELGTDEATEERQVVRYRLIEPFE